MIVSLERRIKKLEGVLPNREFMSMVLGVLREIDYEELSEMARFRWARGDGHESGVPMSIPELGLSESMVLKRGRVNGRQGRKRAFTAFGRRR